MKGFEGFWRLGLVAIEVAEFRLRGVGLDGLGFWLRIWGLVMKGLSLGFGDFGLKILGVM